ncbi:PIN domain-containing protein [Candidatus Woesearchaeota archaeon]|nr:PIN domain-containing protein [Candidatus Woesearchaeota archaeon]
MDDTYFFDTFALIELYHKNQKYARYGSAKIVVTYFQIYELYYNLRKIYSKDEIDIFVNSLLSSSIGLQFEWIKDASEFRLLEKKRNLSYTDCLGYIVSKRLGIKFLTGDKEFKEMQNVEFVK